jgi:hypothetical protein
MPRLALELIAATVPLLAHHSFSAEFDGKRPVRLNGVVTKVEWTNPHAHVYLDVGTEGGRSAAWEVELGSPNVLQREGWTRNSLKAGDHVLVDGFLAKDGTNLASGRDIHRADGRRVLIGPARGGNVPPLGAIPVPEKP